MKTVRSEFEPITFRFPDLPERGTVLSQPPPHGYRYSVQSWWYYTATRIGRPFYWPFDQSHIFLIVSQPVLPCLVLLMPSATLCHGRCMFPKVIGLTRAVFSNAQTSTWKSSRQLIRSAPAGAVETKVPKPLSLFVVVLRPRNI